MSSEQAEYDKKQQHQYPVNHTHKSALYDLNRSETEQRMWEKGGEDKAKIQKARATNGQWNKMPIGRYVNMSESPAARG